MDYMGLDVRRPRKAVKFNHSLTFLYVPHLNYLGAYGQWNSLTFHNLFFPVLGAPNPFTDNPPAEQYREGHLNGKIKALRWRNNELDGVSDHQPDDCLLNLLFRRRSQETSKLRVTGLCAGNSPETGEFPAQKASNAENVSIWWRHHGLSWRRHGVETFSALLALFRGIHRWPVDSPHTMASNTELRCFLCC